MEDWLNNRCASDWTLDICNLGQHDTIYEILFQPVSHAFHKVSPFHFSHLPLSLLQIKILPFLAKASTSYRHFNYWYHSEATREKQLHLQIWKAVRNEFLVLDAEAINGLKKIWVSPFWQAELQEIMRRQKGTCKLAWIPEFRAILSETPIISIWTFVDIESCPVPWNKSLFLKIYFQGTWEKTFSCYT